MLSGVLENMYGTFHFNSTNVSRLQLFFHPTADTQVYQYTQCQDNIETEKLQQMRLADTESVAL